MSSKGKREKERDEGNTHLEINSITRRMREEREKGSMKEEESRWNRDGKAIF